MTLDDVVERIRKLLRLADDAGATEAEAASALERANALLIRHNLTMDAIATRSGEPPAIGEREIRTGWAGSWRGTLAGILARHNLCSPIIRRRGKVDSVVVVGRPANVQATHAMYDWIALQLERLADEEWRAFNRSQRAPGVPWCPGCEDWTETYWRSARSSCKRCDALMLAEWPPVNGFSWKTAFFRGALLRIKHRFDEQRKARENPASHAFNVSRILPAKLALYLDCLATSSRRDVVWSASRAALKLRSISAHPGVMPTKATRAPSFT